MLIYSSTTLTVLLFSGKACCSATNVARNTNMKLCDDADMKKPLYGRKIDLLVNSLSIDISSSEWKRSGVSTAAGKQQQVKNCRTNSAILHNLLQIPIKDLDRPNIFVVGMDWIGMLWQNQ